MVGAMSVQRGSCEAEGWIFCQSKGPCLLGKSGIGISLSEWHNRAENIASVSLVTYHHFNMHVKYNKYWRYLGISRTVHLSLVY